MSDKSDSISNMLKYKHLDLNKIIIHIGGKEGKILSLYPH